MFGVSNHYGVFRRLTRLANDMYRLPRKRRPRPGRCQKPVGPRLVRGRGRPRRRTLSRLGAALVYLILAASLTIVVFKYFVAPFVGL